MGDPKIKKPMIENKVEEVKITGAVRFTNAVPAVVEEVIGRTDTRGGITQVRCRILDGYDKGKILRRKNIHTKWTEVYQK